MEIKKYEVIKDDIRLLDDLVDKTKENISLKSSVRLSWKCSLCNSIWNETICRRKRYDSCPECSIRKDRRICLYEDCLITASYNTPEYDWPKYCSKHRENNTLAYNKMYNIKEVKNCYCEDSIHIGGGSYVCEHNNITVLCYKIAKDWDFKKNGKGPGLYKPNSHKKVYWKCENGHSYQCIIANRFNNNIGCKICKRKY